MSRQCAWCKRGMGQVHPLEDPGLTHGICRPCVREMLRAAGIRELPALLASWEPEEPAHAGEAQPAG
jgi:hypothetical protein